MVYSVFYYATEALTRAVVTTILKIYERMQRIKAVKEKEEKPPKPPARGFLASVNPQGVREYVWFGKATKLRVSIPELVELPIRASGGGRPPVRLYFSYSEAASKGWFKDIEWLAEQVEKMAGGG